MKSIKSLFLILGLPFILHCCKDPNPIHHEPKPELKEWGVFQKGTWWVYQEETTKAIDSFWVDTLIKISQPQDKNHGSNIYLSSYKTILSCESGIEKMFYHVTSSSNILEYTKRVDKGKEYSERCYLMEIPLKKGLREGLGPSWVWAEIDTIYDSIKVGNRYFKNVPRVYDTGNPAFNLDTTYFYTARNVGIIRKEFPRYRQVWNLIKYNINQ
jgi:hypothetical protein